MKKTNHLFKCIIVIATVTFFISCKKEIDRPQKPATQVVNPSTFAMTSKIPKGYVGNGTLGDSSSVHP